MASVNYLGSVNSICTTFPEVTELRWRKIASDEFPVIEDLGIAPPNAYLPLTLEQVVFIHWRVRTWEISWDFEEININRTIVQTFPDYGVGNYQYSFNYPKQKNSDSFLASHIPEGTANEMQISCFSFDPFNNVGVANTTLPIQSTEIQAFEVYDPETPTPPNENYDHSRSVISANNVVLGNWGFWGETVSLDYGRIGDLFYLPLTIDFIAEIADENTDRFLFAEAAEATPDPSGPVEGTLPPIGGRLTSVPRGETQNATTSQYKAYFHMPAPSSEIIEIDLFDATTPSPLSNTRFNVDGFDGITIKPKLYWAYDPNDGDGPIYDTETGAQLRPFP